MPPHGRPQHTPSAPQQSPLDIEVPPSPVPAPAAPGAPPGALVGAASPGSPPRASGAFPENPGGSLRELILPTGRAVRYRKVTTGEYLGARERAAASTGDVSKSPDPNGLRFSNHFDRELLALAVVAVTEPLDWSPGLDAQLAAHELQNPGKPFLPDPEGLLAELPADLWRPVTPLELLTPGGPYFVETLFGEVVDWEVMTKNVGLLLVPSRNLAGIVGKGRKVR